MNVPEKLDALRAQMRQHHMNAYIVPTGDFHGSEYVGDHFKARVYLSGFTGSAGTLVVLEREAALWTDGRYFLQAQAQLTGSGIELMKSGEEGVPKIGEYLSKKLAEGARVGFDGRMVSNGFVRRLAEKTKEKNMVFDGAHDLVDNIWEDRPPLSKEPVWELDISYAGMSREEKLKKLRESMREKKADACLLTALDEIAWLLNLRGNDIAYTPVFLAFMLVEAERATLLVCGEILSEEIRKALAQAGVDIVDYGQIEKLIGALPEGTALLFDGESVNSRVAGCVPAHVKRMEETSPVERMKAVKNEREMENMRRAHIKDGAALTRFIYWLKHDVGKDAVTERSAAKKLCALRAEQEGFLGESFSPIAAYGPHGAIVHYGVTEETDIPLEGRGLCLLDTGGHYLEGTTDVTRTVALGALTREEIHAYTAVLRGHLNLAAAHFPKGICGQNLDVLARIPLWEQHLDYNHGTGHGVGYLLGVHEGPQRIYWRYPEEGRPAALEEGMIMSDEPGFYQAGKFGIRLENLLLCRKDEKTQYGEFLRFETLTMVPFDREAIDVSLMNDRELALLNEYHGQVYRTLKPYLTKEEAKWLAEETAPLVRDPRP